MDEVDDHMSCPVSRFLLSFRVLSADFAAAGSREELERRPGSWLVMARARWGGGRPSGGKHVGTFRRTACTLAAAVRGARPPTGTPAHAESAKGEAKEECKELLQDKGYKGVDVNQAKRTGGDRTRVEADARKNGNDRDVSCVYNQDTGQAHIKK